LFVNLEELARLTKERNCSIFLGAGFSINSGGPDGTRLLNELKDKFGENGENESFSYLQKLINIDTDKRKEVEEFIRKYLIRIEPTYLQKYLFSIPWRAVLTTNYDHIPDLISKTIDGKREIKPILKSADYIDPRKDEILYCFKLFGDCDVSYPDDGYMILTNNDRGQAVTRLDPFFKLFRDLALTGNIIYLGYSFKDQLVYHLLFDLESSWKQTPWIGYAISRSEPKDDKKKYFEKYNLKWVEGDFESFVQALIKVHGKNPISYEQKINLMILNNYGINISRETSLNCRSKYIYLHEDLLEPFNKNPKFFFDGSDTSFYPYHMNWDLKREVIPYMLTKKSYSRFEFFSDYYIMERMNSMSYTQNHKILLTGNAGSGKTILSKRYAYDWYKKGNPVIFIDSKIYRIDRPALEGLIDEIKLNYYNKLKRENATERTLRFLLVADSCSVFLDDILETYDYLTADGNLIDLLVVDRKSKIQERMDEHNFDVIYTIPDTLDSRDRNKFIEHFNNIKLDIDYEIFKNNIENPNINESFFALLYTTIKESRKPLRNIILEEYESLDNEIKYVYASVSLFEALGLKPHLSIISKIAKKTPQEIIDNVKNGKLTGIITINDYYILNTNHKIISDIIDRYEFNSSEKYFSVFYNVVENISKGNEVEEEFIHDLLINRLKYADIDRRINSDKIIELYQRTLNHIETSPLYHHLAIQYLHNQDYESGKYYIKKSHDVHHPKFYSKSEHLLDTEGRLELEEAKKHIENNNIDDAWKHLELSERFFERADYDVRNSPHPVQGMAQCYYYKGVISDDTNTKYNFCLLGLSKIRHLRRNSDFKGAYTHEIEREIYREIEEFVTEDTARNIAEVFRNPDAFAYLAESKIQEDKLEKALELIDEGLGYYTSIWLLSLKVRVLKELYHNDYSKLKNTLDTYRKIETYDLELSFELAKMYFIDGDYYKSYEEFNELKIRSEGFIDRYSYRPENIFYKEEEAEVFRGILTKRPSYNERGIVRATDISKELQEIPVRYYDIRTAEITEKDPVYFNIWFNYTGPQARNVIKR